MVLETSRCVVLNASYEPLSIVTAKRALILILEGKAVVVEEHPTLEVRSVSQNFKVPMMVALKHYIQSKRIFQSKATLTQRNLFMRDNNTCQYCNRHRNALHAKEFLTRDHIVPECRGGRSTWENLVTACSTCNNKKANYNLEDTNMRLLKKPTAPSIFELWMKHAQRRHSVKLLETLH
jgi:5-methylcytosine-specific restriction endonuclease McrA